MAGYFFKKKNGHDGESIHSSLSLHHPAGILRVNFPAIDVSTESRFFFTYFDGILWWFSGCLWDFMVI